MILAWDNKGDVAVVTAGSQIATLPGSNVQNAHLSQKWQTVAAVKSSSLTFDMAAALACSQLAVVGTNLTATAVARLRGSNSDATGQTPVTIDTGNFSTAKTGYGAVYRSVRGKYATVNGAVPTFALDCTGGCITTLGTQEITITRGGATATRYNDKGLIETVAANVPRLDFDPTTLACKGLLIEEARTNILLRSADFSDAAWGKDNCQVFGTAISAPDGTTMQRVTKNAAVAASWGMLTQAVGAINPNGKTFTFSVWLQAEAGTVGGNLKISDVATNTYTQAFVATTTPTRFTFTSAGPFSNVGAAVGAGLDITNIGDSVLVWGAQLEQGALVTSYIPTTAAAATRNADDITSATINNVFGVASGTVVAEFTPSQVGTTGHIVEAELAGGDRLFDWSFGSGTAEFYQSNVGTQFDIVNGVATANATNIVAGAYRKNSANGAVNGSIGVDDVVCVPPGGAMTLTLGAYRNAGAPLQYMNGWLRRVSCFPMRMTNAQLQAITVAGTQTLVDFEPSARYWRLDLTDNSVASNLQIGRVFLGPSWQHKQTMIYGWGVTPEDASPVTKSRGGQSFPDALPKFRSIDFQLKFETESEIYSNPFAAARANGVVKDVLVIPMESSSFVAQQSVWGLCQAQQPVIHENSQYFSQKFHVEERL